LGREMWELDELNYYVAALELHGLSWFSSQSHPHPTGFVQVQLPVIHNYPLILALKGQVCEELYIAGYNMLKRSGSPAHFFNETRIYAYPALVERAYYKKVLMSLSETDYILYKPQTRACVPLMTHHNVLAPGSLAKTVIVSEDEMPGEAYLRIGVKRFGIWKATLCRARVEVVEGVREVIFPFNVSDVKDVLGYRTIMKHYAGDIAESGRVSRALMLRSRLGSLILPIPIFISL